MFSFSNFAIKLTAEYFKCRIGIKLTYQIGSMNCTINTPDAEKLIPYTTV